MTNFPNFYLWTSERLGPGCPVVLLWWVSSFFALSVIHLDVSLFSLPISQCSWLAQTLLRKHLKQGGSTLGHPSPSEKRVTRIKGKCFWPAQMRETSLGHFVGGAILWWTQRLPEGVCSISPCKVTCFGLQRKLKGAVCMYGPSATGTRNIDEIWWQMVLFYRKCLSSFVWLKFWNNSKVNT